MAFERNDIVVKTKLADALGDELMGFEHNDIVTTDVMNAAIAEGGGGGDLTTATVEIITAHPLTKLEIAFPAAFDVDGDCFAQIASYPEAGTYNVILYKGLCYPDLLGSPMLSLYSATGDITIDTDGNFIEISGDGTITYSGE